MSEIEDKIKLVISEHLGVTLKRVVDGAILTDLGADSLDTVELAMAIEEMFGLYIEDDQVSKIKTVGDAVDLVHELS